MDLGTNCLLLESIIGTVFRRKIVGARNIVGSFPITSKVEFNQPKQTFVSLAHVLAFGLPSVLACYRNKIRQLWRPMWSQSWNNLLHDLLFLHTDLSSAEESCQDINGPQGLP